MSRIKVRVGLSLYAATYVCAQPELEPDLANIGYVVYNLCILADVLVLELF